MELLESGRIDAPPARGYALEVPLPTGERVPARVDLYSDRLRCDHPQVADGAALADALRGEAETRDRGMVLVLSPPEVAEGLEEQGFRCDAVMPGFYGGEIDCAVSSLARTPERAELRHPIEAGRVEAILARLDDQQAAPAPGPSVLTERARPEDAAQIAQLIGETFADYPTPSDKPAYVRHAIVTGTPFRIVRDHGEVVSCASADLVRTARAVELTDCATRPSHRRCGHMQALLSGLLEDLRALDYPTAFTLARARVPGINVAFRRLGFELRGRLAQSCRIGVGLEDMNVWSRPVELN